MDSRKSNSVDVRFDAVLKETGGAWLLDFGDDHEVWLPKSQCDVDVMEDTVRVPEWLAIKEGLI